MKKPKSDQLADASNAALSSNDIIVSLRAKLAARQKQLAEAKITITAMHCTMGEKDKEIAMLKSAMGHDDNGNPIRTEFA